MKVKLSDYIANFMVNAGVKHVFMLTGGGAMHLNDSLGKHPGLTVIYNHHEQACAMAAEAYARLSHQLALVNVTTGPGGINALNGVFGAYTDSIPMFVVSGQVRSDTTVHASGLPLRQLGDQEFDIVNCVKGMTKYAVCVMQPDEIKFHLQKAWHLATTGRPGPVWLDIPVDIQSAMIDVDALTGFDQPIIPSTLSQDQLQACIDQLKSAKRPVILAGTGVRLAAAYPEFLQLIEHCQIPTVTAFNAHDLLGYDHPCYAGRPGTVGDRPGNFVVQNADLLIVLGCRLNIRQIGYYFKAFARAAYKVMVDIDDAELHKPTINIDLPIHADLKQFVTELYRQLQAQSLPSYREWLTWCKQRIAKYPVVLPEYWHNDKNINPYCFIEELSQHLQQDAVIVTANATACIATFQALYIKQGQRLFSNSGSASMGYDLPAALGAAIAHRGEVICIAGDGSIQLNLQELATIAKEQLPIKIFILNNGGYHSIRQTQKNYFTMPLLGVGQSSGLFFPDMEYIASAYQLPFMRCTHHRDMATMVAKTLNSHQPAICELMITEEQAFAPKMSSRRLADGRMVSAPLEDMAPFLSREELASNMLIEMMIEE